MRQPYIVYLFGFPAAGKLTVGRELVRLAVAQDDDVLLLDNHHVNDVLFPIVRVGDGVDLSPRLAKHLFAIRHHMLAVVEELAPTERSFVFTNVLVEDPHDIDRGAVQDMDGLAGRTGRLFLPVRLTCEAETLAARIGNVDRRERKKWVDADGVRRMASISTLLQIDCLELDTTHSSPTAVATAILDELDRLRRLGSDS